MATIDEVAKEMSILIPRLIKGIWAKHILPIKDITSSQIVILMLLHEEGHMTVGKIANHMSVSGPTVTGLVDRLVNNNYIARKRNPKDRRQVVVTLTKQGLSTVKLFQETVRKRWRQILGNLTQPERENFISTMRKIVSTAS